MLHDAVELGPVVFSFEEYMLHSITLFSWILILYKPV